ncbi:MAG: DUF4833 domain-containing protein [Bacteroidales bacterium]|nr:DUF4833 domain-containing protein [Bacteroidales bacterium]
MKILISLIVGLIAITATAHEPVNTTGLKASSAEEVLLFQIERSRDADEIWYTVNLDYDGSVNREMPLKVFWVKKSEDNRIEPLTAIQKRFSYGIKTVQAGPSMTGEWNFSLAAYKNRVFTLKKTTGGPYKVYTLSEGRNIEILKMYVKFSGGTFLSPSVEFVQLSGIDLLSGNEIIEIITGEKGI